MKIKLYNKCKNGEEYFNTFEIETPLKYVLRLEDIKTSEQSGRLGGIYILICNKGYFNNNKIDLDNLNLNFEEINYITVDDKDKFIIKTKDDVKNFYKYLTGFDVNLFIKEFGNLDRVNSVEKDFQ